MRLFLTYVLCTPILVGGIIAFVEKLGFWSIDDFTFKVLLGVLSFVGLLAYFIDCVSTRWRAKDENFS